MKRITAILLAVLMVLSLAACAGENGTSGGAEPPQNSTEAPQTPDETQTPSEENESQQPEVAASEPSQEPAGSKILVPISQPRTTPRAWRRSWRMAWAQTSMRSYRSSPIRTRIWIITATVGPIRSKTTARPAPRSPALWRTWSSTTWCSSAIPTGGRPSPCPSPLSWRNTIFPAKRLSRSAPTAAAVCRTISPRGCMSITFGRVIEVKNMSLTVNIYYTGKNGSARQFAEEMVSSGLVAKVRAEAGNQRADSAGQERENREDRPFQPQPGRDQRGGGPGTDDI